jgi:hypothetical protein
VSDISRASLSPITDFEQIPDGVREFTMKKNSYNIRAHFMEFLKIQEDGGNDL